MVKIGPSLGITEFSTDNISGTKTYSDQKPQVLACGIDLYILY